MTWGAYDGDAATHLPGAAGGDHLALGEDDDVVGDRGDELDVVGRDEDGVAVVGQVADDRGELALGA